MPHPMRNECPRLHHLGQDPGPNGVGLGPGWNEVGLGSGVGERVCTAGWLGAGRVVGDGYGVGWRMDLGWMIQAMD